MNSTDLQARNQQNRHEKMVLQLFDPRTYMINGENVLIITHNKSDKY